MDYKQVYDSLNREELWKTMINFNIQKKYINMVKLCNEKIVFKVKFLGELSLEFEVNSGVRQGGALFPILFNKDLEKVIRELSQKKKKIEIVDKELILAYSNDIVISDFFNLYQDWNIKFYHVNTHHDFLKTSIIYKNYVPSYIHFLETEDSNNNYINSYVAFLEHLKRKNNYVPSRAEFLETFDTNKNYLPSYLHFLETEDSNNTIPYDNLTPSSWCAINDVSAKKNIELVMLPTFSKYILDHNISLVPNA
ncbi:hypothetical protein QTP88_009835 [Uroleucon formosanum]